MMKEIGVSQHNIANCSVTDSRGVLFVCTSDVFDVEHNYIPPTPAPSFFAIDKIPEEVLWTDNWPGSEGSARSIVACRLPMPGPRRRAAGDLRRSVTAGSTATTPKSDGDGHSKLLWKFDADPKTSTAASSAARHTRNHIIATPVIHATGARLRRGRRRPGARRGHRTPVVHRSHPSAARQLPELTFNSSRSRRSRSHPSGSSPSSRRGHFTRPNPGSAVIWRFFANSMATATVGSNSKLPCAARYGSVAIKDNVLYVADFSGTLHCLDAKTGKVDWNHDMSPTRRRARP